ncbi:transcriptional adapter 2-alpha-like [Amphiura filiformis]|uniref:transcriptional adapter 2-alpha-like n=1 Tax=Amphiura filiformis TaxID=82378 RepID=UPI003B218525
MALVFLTDDQRPPCPGCSTYLMEPYIRCAKCGPPHLQICLQCFSRGWEDSKHQSDHDYEIIANEFCILESGWTAKDELKLMEAVGDCGFGNWHDIANQIPGKTKQECEQHYIRIFVENAKPPFPVFGIESKSDKADVMICRLSDDPPRPIRDTQKAGEMAGYMPARGDFVMEHDNYAEWDLKDIYFHTQDDKLLNELKYAAVDIYQSRLKERLRRKKIIRNLGLINLSRQKMQERAHSQPIRELFDKLRKFSRLHTPVEQDKLIEGLIYEIDLRREIVRLQEYRECGIKTFIGARLFDRLKARRQQMKTSKNHLDEVLGAVMRDPYSCRQWLQRQALVEAGHSCRELPPIAAPVSRKSATPLDLASFAGYEKLTEKEREMCASVRVIPEAYFEYKTIFQNECDKVGYLKLKHARTLIRIDVNKILKMFDFMVKEGIINATSPS